MFNLFRKKTDVEKHIAADGIDYATDRFAEIIARKLPTREIALQFTLQELDGASIGDDASQRFAAGSGIHPSQYLDALNESRPEVNGTGGPQETIEALSLDLIANRPLMAKFRCMIADKIMQHFELGKYAGAAQKVADLLEQLKRLLMEDRSVMESITRNIAVPDGAVVRHAHYRGTNQAAAKEIVSLLVKLTGNTTDAIVELALGYSGPGSGSDLAAQASSTSNLIVPTQRATAPPSPPTAAKPRLVDVIARVHETELGPFEDLNRDLGHFIDQNYETCDPMLLMAYGYARRVAMSGLFFQRIVQQNVVSHVQDIFTALQSTTGQTVDFQREAAAQATEILRLYVAGLDRQHEKALIHYARTGVTADELAQTHGVSTIDELEDLPVSIDKCLELIDYVIDTDEEAASLFDPGPTPSATRLRLIDVVEKNNKSNMGPFGCMCDDIRASGPRFVGNDLLWAASGYAYLLGACAVFVGGGVHARLIDDAMKFSQTMMSGLDQDPAVAAICKEQAVALAMTYCTRFTTEAANVIMERGLKREPFVRQDDSKLSGEEVVLRARKIARDRG